MTSKIVRGDVEYGRIAIKCEEQQGPAQFSSDFSDNWLDNCASREQFE